MRWRRRSRDLSRAGRPAVLAPDAETEEDLAAIAAGYAAALREGAEVVVRCAPAFAGILAGTTAHGLAPMPTSAGRLLVVCGSWVPMSTRQLRALDDAYPGLLVEVDVRALAGPSPTGGSAARAAASAAIARAGLAILATPRDRPDGTTGLDAGRRIAEGLARAAGLVEPAPDVVIAKGGITSAVTLLVGFGEQRGRRAGPGAAGRLALARSAGGPLDYLVVPGNVGDERLLVDARRPGARRVSPCS